MDLFQCVLPGSNRNGEEDSYTSKVRQTKSADRDVQFRTPLYQQERGQSLPHYGHQEPQRSKVRVSDTMRQRNPSSTRSASSNGGGMRHWGSSLSLASDVSVNDLTRRTLRPPSPTTLSRASTPSRQLGPPEICVKPKTVPMTLQSNMDYPMLADYLVKPRLVSTLGCGGVKPWSQPSSEHHARRMACNEIPPYRNLRLGGFLDHNRQQDSEVIPDMLRQYYYDTYLDSCDTPAGSTKSGLLLKPMQRGM